VYEKVTPPCLHIGDNRKTRPKHAHPSFRPQRRYESFIYGTETWSSARLSESATITQPIYFGSATISLALVRLHAILNTTIEMV
jgi:hypothetical protein